MAKKIIHKIKLKTWVALGLLLVLLPLVIFTIVYKDSLLAALGGSSANPAAHWAFDEGTADTCSGGANDACDSSGNANDGAFGATTAAPTIRAEDLCISGKCLFFDGSDDTATIANTVASVQSITFWVKVMSTSTTQEILALNGLDTFSSVSGTLTVAGFGTNTVYVDGKAATTLTANRWHHVTVTSTTSFSASAITMGNISTNFGNLFLDELKLFTVQLNSDQVKAEYAGGAAIFADKTAFLNNGLVGYWKIDDASGNGVTDSSGNGNNGTATDNTVGNGDGNTPPPISAGKFGNARDWDGTDDYVTVSDPGTGSVFDLSSTLTLSAWIYPDVVTGNAEVINKKADSVSSGYRLRRTASTFLLAFGDGVTSQINVTSPSLLTASTWQHIAATYDGKTVRLFYNGVQVLEEAHSEVITANNSAVILGGYINLSAYWWNGKIDETRMYNRALSGKEIQALYNWAPGPVAYYKMDESAVGDRYDSSGNNNTLTESTSDDIDPVQGKFGKAGQFTASQTEYLNITDNAFLSAGDVDFTVSAWVYLDSKSTERDIITKYNAGANQREYALVYNSSADQFRLIVSNDGTAVTTLDASTFGSPSTGTWYFVVGWHDSVNNLIGIQVNSTQDTSSYSSGVFDGTADFVIGSLADPGEYWDGKIDEVRVYKYRRTAQQIVEDMNAGHPTGGSPIGSQVIRYAFNEQYGDTVNNLNPSQASLTGVRSGATWKTKENCKEQGCLDFDGTDDVVTVTNAAAIDLNDNLLSGFTFSAWVNPDTVGEGSAGQIFVKSTTTNCALGGSTPFNITCSADLATDATVTLNSVISASTWTHVAVSYTDDGDDEITVWINGVARGTSINGVGPTSAESSNLLIGGGTANNFDGKIDEFKIYSSELTSDQIKIDKNFGGVLNFAVGSDEASQITDGADNPPVGYWDMNEGSWTVDCSTDTVFDKSGNNYHGDACPNSTGPAGGAAGKIGKAGNFDGAGDYVSVPVGSFSVYTGTVSMWLTNNQNWNDLTVIQSPFSTAQDGSGDLFNIEMTDLETLKVQFWDGFSANLRSVTVTPTGGWPLANTWHHLEVTWSGSLDNLSNTQIYLDGVALTLSADQNITTDAIGSTLNIGGNNPIGDREDWAGKIDDVKIYDYARTPAQVAYDYSRGGPVAWWRFNECSGTTANNAGSLGSTLNGTITPQSNENTAVGDCTTSASTMWFNGATGKFNSGLDFDGNDDYIVLTDTIVTDFASTNTPFSVSTWVIPEEANGDSQRIIHKTEAVAPATIYNWNLVWSGEQAVNTDRTFVFTLQRDSTFYDAEGPAELATDQWYHLVGVWNGTSSTLYINGKPYTNDGTGTYGGRADGTFEIGSGVTTAGHTDFFNGKIDEVQLFNYALSGDQIRKLYNDNSTARFGPTTGSP